MESPAPTPLSLTAELTHDGENYIATCPEFPGVQGKGPTDMEALLSLKEAMDTHFLQKYTDERVE